VPTTLTDVPTTPVPVEAHRAPAVCGTPQEIAVPKSRNRRRSDFTPPATAKLPKGGRGRGAWVVPTMLVLLVGGLAWIVTFYLAGNDVPLMKSLGDWNLAIGMAAITAGFIVATRWE
jgi:Cell division protein CrgA